MSENQTPGVMAAVPADAPVMLSWRKYQDSEECRNSVYWGLRLVPFDQSRESLMGIMQLDQRRQHLEGSLWAAFQKGFCNGWELAKQPILSPDCPKPKPAQVHYLGGCTAGGRKTGEVESREWSAVNCPNCLALKPKTPASFYADKAPYTTEQLKMQPATFHFRDPLDRPFCGTKTEGDGLSDEWKHVNCPDCRRNTCVTVDAFEGLPEMMPPQDAGRIVDADFNAKDKVQTPPSAVAITIAGSVWYDDKTKNIPMDRRIRDQFAEVVDQILAERNAIKQQLDWLTENQTVLREENIAQAKELDGQKQQIGAMEAELNKRQVKISDTQFAHYETLKEAEQTRRRLELISRLLGSNAEPGPHAEGK